MIRKDLKASCALLATTLLQAGKSLAVEPGTRVDAAVVPYTDWSRFYMGGQLGYAWGDSAWRVDSPGASDEGTFRFNRPYDAATTPGLPATVAPVELSKAGLPIGAQIIGPYLEDRTTIAFAGLLEREFGGFVPPPGMDG